MPLRTPLTRNASYLLAGLTLFLALQFHAIAPLFMGLLVYQMIQLAASVSHIHRLAGKNAHLVALILIATCVIAVLCLFALGLYWVSASEANSLPNMLQQLESINAALKKDLPPW